MIDLLQKQGVGKLAFHAILALGFALGALAPAYAGTRPADLLDRDPIHYASDAKVSTNMQGRTDEQPAQRAQADEIAWPMAGANPQRTSWTAEEVRGTLRPIWYRPIEPFISQKTQIIAANSLLYVSTARGLYALNADNGAIAWVYPTELPLGHSPTIHNGVAYVGGLDHRIHAINALTGAGIWTFEALKGFQTNPLVLELAGSTYILAGNRDGAMYAIQDLGSSAALAWKYQTEGPVLFSAAYHDGVIYFASNDSRAYALNATTGTLVWRSSKLLGAGFQSWWPVVYTDPQTQTDYLLIPGSNNYRFWLEPGPPYDIQQLEMDDLYAFNGIPVGSYIAPINHNDEMDATRILEYYERKPWRRTYFVLNAATGAEYRPSYQRGDGTTGRSYAPITWLNTHGPGNRYPPVIGSDGTPYLPMHYNYANQYIAHGGIVGWEPGNDYVTVSGPDEAMDEPMAFSGGGNLIYWARNNDRMAGAFDITMSTSTPYREWVYFSYDLDTKIPGYNTMYYSLPCTTDSAVYQGATDSVNGIYGLHGEQNAPIPYAGRVYMHRSNAIIAFGAYTGSPTLLPTAAAVEAPATQSTAMGSSDLVAALSAEVQRMVDAGHLRPGYQGAGLFDIRTKQDVGDYLLDYWHSPSDTLYVLLLALPHLAPDLRDQAAAYIQSEMAAYPPYQYSHVGWRDGAAREVFTLPPEVESDRATFGPMAGNYGYEGWTFPPHMLYALWKYAETFGGATALFDQSRNRLESPPSNTYLLDNPQVHNAYIAGYLGYLELERLAGYPESASVRSELDDMMALRADTFSAALIACEDSIRPLGVALNFMYLVPELAEYLREDAFGAVSQALAEYETIAPYWFVTRTEQLAGEGVIQPLYDSIALFQARALIMRDSREELLKYLDVPAFPTGDLFYIQNLIAAIEAAPYLEKDNSPHHGYFGDIVDYQLTLVGDGRTLIITDTLPAGLGAPTDIQLVGTTVEPDYDSIHHRLTWSDAPQSGQAVTIGYSMEVNTPSSMYLVNLVELRDQDDRTATASAGFFANPRLAFLPVIAR